MRKLHKTHRKSTLFQLSFINISPKLQDTSLTKGDSYQASCFWVYEPFRRKKLLIMCRGQGFCYTPCGILTRSDAYPRLVLAEDSHVPWKPTPGLLCAFPYALLSHGLDYGAMVSIWTVLGSFHEES